MTAIAYEYHNGTLGIQGRFLFKGRRGTKAADNSLCLVGYDAFNRLVKKQEIIELRPNAPGQPTLVKWDSLPPAWQGLCINFLGKPAEKTRKTLFEENYIRSAEAFDFYSTYTELRLSGNHIEEYTLNASVLDTCVKIYENRRNLRKKYNIETNGAWDIVAKECSEFRAVQPHTLPESSDWLRRTFNKYRKATGNEKYKVLISGRHGNDNRRLVYEEDELMFNDLFSSQKTKPNMTEVAELYRNFLNGTVEVINNATGEFYNPCDFPRVSDSTVCYYLARWENKIATHLVRSGDRQQYMAKFKPYHSLTQPDYAGSIISIDDRQPVFEYPLANGKGARMWFYNGIDVGSEAFVCWVYGKSKEGIILEFYRQMVRNYAEWGLNLPAELECESSLNSSFKDTFLQEGNMFQYVRIEANNARGKRIEQYYRPLRYKYEKQREGWLARPFALSEANQAGGDKKIFVPYENIINGCLRDIETWNNTEHSKIKGKSRWEVFMETQNPNLRPTNYRGIIPHLGYRTKTSVNAGIIRFRGSEFLLAHNGILATGERLIDLMTLVEGRDVQIRWLDKNDGSILKAYVFIGEELMCEAVAKPVSNRARIEQTPEDEANRELMSRYVATIDGYARRRKSEFSRLTVIDNTPRTISNTFKMPRMATAADVMMPDYDFRGNSIEVMPNPEDEFESVLNDDYTAFKSDYRERF
jgi:hypothetical protein